MEDAHVQKARSPLMNVREGLRIVFLEFGDCINQDVVYGHHKCILHWLVLTMKFTGTHPPLLDPRRCPPTSPSGHPSGTLMLSLSPSRTAPVMSMTLSS